MHTHNESFKTETKNFRRKERVLAVSALRGGTMAPGTGGQFPVGGRAWDEGAGRSAKVEDVEGRKAQLTSVISVQGD